MLNLKTDQLHMPILLSRPSKSYRTKNNATFRDDSFCFRNSLVIKRTISERKFSFIKNKDCEWTTTTMMFVFSYSKDICICLVSQIDFNVSETCLRVAIHVGNSYTITIGHTCEL